MSYGDETTTASAYLVLVPDIRGTGKYRYVSSVRVDRVRSGKPSLASGEIAVKVSLRFKDSALMDNIPEIAMDVTGFAVGHGIPETAEVAAA